MLKRISAIGLLLVLGMNIASFAGEQPVQKFNVRTFLEASPPPPISKIVYFMSLDMDSAGRALKGQYRKMEGAWEGNTYYFSEDRKIDGIVVENSYFCGRSSDNYYWVIDKTQKKYSGGKDIVVIEDSKSTKPSLAATTCIGEMMHFNDFLALGIHVAKPGTFKWIDDRRFVAELDFDPRPDIAGKTNMVSGTVSKLDDKMRIQMIEYSWEAIPSGAKCWVEYGYNKASSNHDLPGIIINGLQLTRLGVHTTMLQTNIIEKLVIGTTNIGPNGYTPGMFTDHSSSNPPPQLTLVTNKIFYSYDGGRWVLNDPTKTATVLNSRQSAGMFFSACLLMCLILWRLWRHGKLGNAKHKITKYND